MVGQGSVQSWSRTWSSSADDLPQLGYVERMPGYTKRRSSLESSASRTVPPLSAEQLGLYLIGLWP